MVIKAYAKINFILNVLGRRPDGYHEVEMLMQAIDLCDLVTVETDDPQAEPLPETNHACILGPRDFEYGISDLACRAAVLMAETFRPELITNALDGNGEELAPGVRGVRVCVEKHTLFRAYFCNLLHGLNRSDFVVCSHNGYKTGLVRNRIFNIFGLDYTVFINIDKRNLKALFFQSVERVKNRVMLKFCRYDMVFTLYTAEICRCSYCLIICFGTA